MRSIGGGVVAAVICLGVLMMAPPGSAAEAPASGDGAEAAAPGQGSVVVNEFAPSDPDWQFHEFVELRNTGNQTVALHGWELVACLSPGTWRVAKAFGFGDVIGSGGYLLLAHPDYDDFTSPPPDYFYDIELPDDGGWLLYDPWSGYTDAVGLRNGLTCTEGSPAPQCEWADGEGATRDEAGEDTDDNAADFTCRARTPGR